MGEKLTPKKTRVYESSSNLDEQNMVRGVVPLQTIAPIDILEKRTKKSNSE